MQTGRTGAKREADGWTGAKIEADGWMEGGWQADGQTGGQAYERGGRANRAKREANGARIRRTIGGLGGRVHRLGFTGGRARV